MVAKVLKLSRDTESLKDLTMVSSYLFLLLAHWLSSVQGDMKVLHEWSSVDYVWPSSQDRDNAIRDGKYNASSVAILDVDVFDPANYGNSSGNKEKRIFVTTPKLRTGIPVTLSTLSSKRSEDGSPLLEPFPNWDTHSEGNCDGLTSVFRVDECGRLWVLDTGKLNAFGETPKVVCPPQIVVYDLNQGDKVILRHKFPDSQIAANSLPLTIVIDTRNPQCTRQYAYIADVSAYKLLVFDLERKESWRVSSNYFYPDPKWGTFDLNGVRFDMTDGLFGIGLGPLVNGDRRVYFNALASVNEGWTLASILLNQTLLASHPSPTDLFRLSEFTRSSQSSNEIWTEYKQENFVTLYTNNQTYQFQSGMKLIANKDLYVLTSRLQIYITTGRTDTSQINYRILTAPISDLTRSTACNASKFDATGYLTLDKASS
ncbi:hypothetical protein M8J75_011525 [Diaphorina citri]|nr:hypothetical protein M8J75_011525 [Diaphorina citri]